MKIRNQHYQLATKISGSQEISNEAAIDVLIAEVARLGWTWQEPQVVVDPVGKPHYINADGGLLAQAESIIVLDAELKALGMLEMEGAE